MELRNVHIGSVASADDDYPAVRANIEMSEVRCPDRSGQRARAQAAEHTEHGPVRGRAIAGPDDPDQNSLFTADRLHPGRYRGDRIAREQLDRRSSAPERPGRLVRPSAPDGRIPE